MAAILENPNPPHEPRHRALAQGRPGIRIRTIAAQHCLGGRGAERTS